MAEILEVRRVVSINLLGLTRDDCYVLYNGLDRMLNDLNHVTTLSDAEGDAVESLRSMLSKALSESDWETN
jgi:hypothetical protein